MGASSGAPISGRKRGSIVVLPSGSLQVRVFAGVDPLTRKRLYLTSVIPAGPKAARQAEAERVRLVNQVNEKRNPRPVVGQPG